MDISNKVLEIYNLNPDGDEWVRVIGHYEDTLGEDWDKNCYLIYHYLLELKLSRKSKNKTRMFYIKKAKRYTNIKINIGIKNFKEFYDQFTLEAFKIIGI